MKFIIDRKKWNRGFIGSYYDPYDGFGCVIGHALVQSGGDPIQLSGCLGTFAKGVPEDVFTDGLCRLDWVTKCIHKNDSPMTSDQKKEAQIKAIAASAGHEFEFIN